MSIVNKFTPGTKVKHWFAGYGVVRSFINKKTVSINYISGEHGIAYLRDLKKIYPQDNP